MRKITNLKVLNEAYDYEKPSCFSRGVEVNVGGQEMIFISGTASIDENGVSIHVGDFESQAIRMFLNVKALLESQGSSWKNVAKTTVYMKHIDEHYDSFNRVRKSFFESEGITIYPASVCVEAKLCRPELLIEMDAIAIKPAFHGCAR